MATTDAPYSIWSPDGTEPSRLKTLLRTMALSIHAAFQTVSPSGSIVAYVGASAPSGWLLCQGQAVSRSTYANLFSVIGTTYGNGDGTSTFNLPNFKGRVPVGFDSGQDEFDTLGKKSGSKTVTLTIDQMPTHNHAQVVTANEGTDATRRDYSSDGGAQKYSQGVSTGDAGGGESHNNLQPYIVTNFIIKT